MKDIQTLLDRYWEGETTMEEERALKAYFEGDEVAEELRHEAAYFKALQTEKALQYAQTAQRIALPPAQWSFRRYAALAAALATMLISAALWHLAPSNTLPTQPVAQQATTTPPTQETQQGIVAQVPDIQADKRSTLPAAKKEKHTRKHKKQDIQAPEAPNEAPLARNMKENELDAETQLALEEIRAALALVSSKLNKGKSAAAKQINHIETLERFIKTPVHQGKS